MIVRAYICLAFLSVAFLPRAAQGAPTTATDGFLNQGITFMEKGDYKSALMEFRKADAENPTPRSVAQIGLAEQALGRWVDAETHITDALAHKNDIWINPRRVYLDKALVDVRSHLAHLLVTGIPAGAEVLLDEEIVGVLPFQRPLRIVVGTRQLEVRAAGFETTRKTIHAGVGENARHEIALATRPVAQAASRPPVTTPPKPGASGEGPLPLWRRITGIGALTVGGAAASFGAALIWMDGRPNCRPKPGSAGLCQGLFGTQALGIGLLAGGAGLVAAGVAAIALPSPAGMPQASVAFGPGHIAIYGTF
jgi:tetratricopeptide (TPR) repeat protein